MPSGIPGDDDLVAAATAGIARLNARYPNAAGADRFLLLHRRRVLERGAGRWMGWERKRGKLHELNRLLRGATDTTFLDTGSRPPTDIRYVVTLDSDTRLPRDAIQRLVGKMAHPLNRPRLDPVENRVVEGYGVLQPRVTPSLPVGAEGSLFQRIFSSNSGIDPYSSAVSDVYQDLFGEGLLLRQGHLRHRRLRGRAAGPRARQYDAEPRSLRGRVRPLGPGVRHRGRRGISRPLRRGRGAPASLGARRLAAAALAARPREGAGRRTRPGPCRRSASGRCSTICGAPCRRRPSLVALLAGWTLPLPAALVWTGFVLLTVALPTILPVIAAPCAAACRHHAAQPFLGAWRRISLDALAQTALLVVFLAHQAWLMLDAIGRTLYPAVRQPSPSARLDHRGPVHEHAAHRLDRLLRPDGGKPPRSRRWPRCSSGMPAARRCRSPRPSSSPGCSRPRSRAG